MIEIAANVAIPRVLRMLKQFLNFKEEVDLVTMLMMVKV